MERYTVSMPLLPSALPPKGEASRYGANIFLNLIALPDGEGLEGLLIAGFPRIVSLPLEGKVPRRGG